MLSGSRKPRSSRAFVCGGGWKPREGPGRALGMCACMWTPGGGSHGSTGCLESYKMAARVPHPRLDSPTFVLTRSNGNRTFRPYKKRWRRSITQRALVFFFSYVSFMAELACEMRHMLLSVSKMAGVM